MDLNSTPILSGCLPYYNLQGLEEDTHTQYIVLEYCSIEDMSEFDFVPRRCIGSESPEWLNIYRPDSGIAYRGY